VLTVDLPIRRRPVAQPSLQSVDFPEIPTGEPSGNSVNNIRSTPIPVPILEQPFTTEPLRASPEPAGTLRYTSNGQTSAPDEDGDLSKFMELLQRNPELRRKFSTFVENTSSEHTPLESDNRSNGSTARLGETSSARRRDTQNTSQSTQRQEATDSHPSSLGSSMTRARGESTLTNGTHHSWLQLEEHDRLSSQPPPPQSFPLIGNLIGFPISFPSDE